MAELWITGEISAYSWSGSLESLRSQFDENEITDVYINSPGGDAFEGLAMYDYLKAKSINIIGTGVVASVASVMLMAAPKKRRFMTANAKLMVHNPWTYAQGDAATLERTAEELRAIEDQLIEIYHDATGIAKSKLRKLMDEETWLTADEAVEMGFVSGIYEPVKAFAKLDMSNWTDKLAQRLGVKADAAAAPAVDTAQLEAQLAAAVALVEDLKAQLAAANAALAASDAAGAKAVEALEAQDATIAEQAGQIGVLNKTITTLSGKVGELEASVKALQNTSLVMGAKPAPVTPAAAAVTSKEQAARELLNKVNFK